MSFMWDVKFQPRSLYNFLIDEMFLPQPAGEPFRICEVFISPSENFINHSLGKHSDGKLTR